MKTYHITVKGRVQGVGFRYYTLQRAQSLGVKGWVKNRPDGSVEIMVSGQGQALNTFIDAIKEGPSFSRVESVDFIEEPVEHKALPSPFTIR